MSYATIVRMANDGDLQQRFIACAAQEEVLDPAGWVMTNRWSLMASDSVAIDDYQYAFQSDVNRLGQLGRREDVITDAKILSITQALIADQAAV